VSANEAYFDAMVRHQIMVLRLPPAIRRKIEVVLDRTEKEIGATIRGRLAGVDAETPAGVRRMMAVQDTIKTIRTKAWTEVNAVWTEELIRVANMEATMMRNILVTSAPVVVDTILPGSRMLKSIVTSRPFEGRTLREWAKSIQEADLRRIENAIQSGMVAGETPRQLAQRVVGSARLNGTDGVTEITRRQAEAITRTAVNHVSNQARNEFMKENAELFSKERFVATLDSRTTPVCMAMDGKIFDVGKGPIPPLHFGCRSLRVAELYPEAMGDRPAKPTTQRQLLREFAKEKGLDKAPRTRDGLPHGTKGAFDQFSRKRVREMTGQIPGQTTYQDWLTRQPKVFQEDVLGKTKAQLFRDGNLPLDRFINRNGDSLTLAQLARKEAAAFRAAGLDPKDWR
jgi:SPP1 gp7 family putative phage head morphogenesis protein